jgi:hypothetical protein
LRQVIRRFRLVLLHDRIVTRVLEKILDGDVPPRSAREGAIELASWWPQEH